MAIRPNQLVHLAIFALFMLGADPARHGGHAQTGKIASIKVSGSHRFSEEQIAAASGVHLGDSVRREDIQAAADRLAQLGPFSQVQYRFSSAQENLTVEFQVEDATEVPVSFDNFPWFTNAELTQALRGSVVLFDGNAPEQGAILEAMTRALQKLL